MNDIKLIHAIKYGKFWLKHKNLKLFSKKYWEIMKTSDNTFKNQKSENQLKVAKGVHMNSNPNPPSLLIV